MQIIGLDIGGANLKAADADGRATARPFPVWKEPDGLPAALSELLAGFARPDLLAVTMTAELADCFETKRQGVESVLRSVEQAAGGVPVFVWQTGAEFLPSETAREVPLLVAAANWHALATWVGRMAPDGSALLIDIGSTTTDLIPLLRGVPVPAGLTDRERLQSGELVYGGVRRTPVCALAHTVPYLGDGCPLAAELFATTLDVYLTLGDLPEAPDDRDTANGRPATTAAARDRLARMLCCDRDEFTHDDALTMARFLADIQGDRITAALDRVLARQEEPCRQVLVSGSGTFLAERIVRNHPRLKEAEMTSLADMIAGPVSEAACAFAVARLAAERLP